MIQFEAAMQEEAKKQKSARADTLVKTPRYVTNIEMYIFFLKIQNNIFALDFWASLKETFKYKKLYF